MLMSGDAIWNGIKVDGSVFRSYCYEDYTYDPEHPLDGFLRSELLLRVRTLNSDTFFYAHCYYDKVFLYIYISPRHARKLRRADLSEDEDDVTAAALAAVASTRRSSFGSGGRRNRQPLPREFREDESRRSLDGRVCPFFFRSVAH